MLAYPGGHTRIGRSVEQNRPPGSERTEEFRRNDEPFPLRTQTHQVDIRRAESRFQLGLRREWSDPDIRVVPADLIPHKIGTVAADAERKDDLVLLQNPCQFKESFVRMSAPEIPGVQQPEFRVAKKRCAHFRIRSTGLSRLDESPRDQSFFRRLMTIKVEAPPHAGSQIGDQRKITVGGAGEPLQESLEAATGGKHPVSDSSFGIEVKTPVGKPRILAEESHGPGGKNT